MAERTVQLVLHYDGSGFSGWQRQPEQRTVQGVIEHALERLCGTAVAAVGSGRTDAGVHARGQAVGVRVPSKWTPDALRRALNAILPEDVWVAAAFEMRPDFHARYSAIARRYRYYVGTDSAADSPFRRRTEHVFPHTLDRDALTQAAQSFIGQHSFRAFAVKGTAPEADDHVCDVSMSQWAERSGGIAFEVEANRFLHHMVRFLVGTMLDVASGRRPGSDIPALLNASDNRDVSAPAPANALFLESVTYPAHLYVPA
jgi:tRNA pseudouridine38-40 synthase